MSERGPDDDHDRHVNDHDRHEHAHAPADFRAAFAAGGHSTVQIETDPSSACALAPAEVVQA